MPKILAVDDSATMRRVLELTFAGIDGFDVVSFESSDAALAHASTQGADLVIADASMSPDGYELCARLKSQGSTSGIPVLILGSQHTPLDAERAKSVGADETALKPYDTAAFIEKVRTVIAKGAARSAPQVATYRTAPGPTAGGAGIGKMAPTSAVPAKKPTLELADDDEPVVTVGPAATAPVAPPALAAKPAAPLSAPTGGRPMKTTVAFGASAPLRPAPASATPAGPAAIHAAPTAQASPPPAVPGVIPRSPAPATPAASTPSPGAADAPAALATQPSSATAPSALGSSIGSTVVAATASRIAPKLDGMGLTPEQVQAVLTLTREVVERVVWEVVPDLAETIIREEIARLTAK